MQPIERLVVPQNHTPVHALACRVEPQGDPGSYVSLLAEAGPIHSGNCFKETSQARAILQVSRADSEIVMHGTACWSCLLAVSFQQ